MVSKVDQSKRVHNVLSARNVNMAINDTNVYSNCWFQFDSEKENIVTYSKDLLNNQMFRDFAHISTLTDGTNKWVLRRLFWERTI